MPLTDDEFDAVFVANYRPLLRYARRRVHSLELAESVVSETFLTAWNARSGRRQISLPWLYRVAHTAIVHHARRAGTHVLSPLSPDPSESEADRPILHLDRGVLVDAINALRRTEREAILLTYWEQLSIAELAISLGCREQKARSVLARSQSTLERLIGQDAATSALAEGVRDVVPKY